MVTEGKPGEIGAFSVEVHDEDMAVRVTPVGEMDMVTVGLVDAILREVTEAGCRRLVLDLRKLGFMDSTGLKLVIDWHMKTSKDAVDFALIQGGPAIARLFEITGTAERFTFVGPDARAPGEPRHVTIVKDRIVVGQGETLATEPAG